MEALSVPYAPSRPMEVDACEPCRALWFDTGEHIRLGADGALALIRHLAAQPRALRGRLAVQLACPICRRALARAFDIAGGTQYRYFRCIEGHGVFITVFDFLRSRGLVRGLSPMELEALREQLSSVSCPGCGAPVDLDGEPACGYCGTVISIIDTDHLAAALRQLTREAPAPAPVTGPTLAEEDVVAQWRADRPPRDGEAEWGRFFGRRQRVDLLDLGVAALSWLTRQR
jgi:endogenous inhibitor of DNA gyrase (YacG/DUF329 family)